ncbi:unnamed protein product [Anisakis simplex]|uniref:Doublecortin domain-containing protein n=1 Tax=Anisakis simplex TaxID=6269 RepID=A0A0M3JTJ6_ANISI|nr:unnamed protein product [Anisakis simplex]
MGAPTSRSATRLPNLPDPVNGKIKTYDCSHRTFTRPYSAKTVYFYKEGDVYFTGVRIPVSKSRYRNMESLLDDLNSNIQMPFGVRRLTTPHGRTPIKSIDQLQHLGRYVASSTKAPRPLNFAAIERVQRTRGEQHQQIRRNRVEGTSFWLPTSPSFNAKLRMSRSLGLSYLPTTAKQMLFVLNGKPSRIYRALLNPLKMKTFDALLEEVSQENLNDSFVVNSSTSKKLMRKDDDDSGRPQSPEEFGSEATSTLQDKHNDAMNDGDASHEEVSSASKVRGTSSSSQAETLHSSEAIILEPEKDHETEESNGNLSERNGHESSRTSHEQAEGKSEANSPSMLTETQVENEIGTEERREEADEGIESVDSSKDDDSVRNKAATIIQACFRGYLVRRQISNGGPDSAFLLNGFGPELRSFAEIRCESDQCTQGNSVESDEEKDIREKAAIAIQTAWRKYATRKTLQSQDQCMRSVYFAAVPETDSKSTCQKQPSVIDEEETSNKSENGAAVEAVNEVDAEIEQDNEKNNKTTYTISVITGNRWAADTDKDLYIILHGDLDKSGKHLLRQDYINWLQTNEPKFQQNHMDSFHIETAELGCLQKIVIGHECIGYGAGIFIERVLVTENIADGKQFLFQCGKWLDSGQVDGKIERIIKTTAFYHIASIPDDSTATKGRWELILHTGKKDGTGGTTSNLSVVGYGTCGSSLTTKIYDSKLMTAPSCSLVQVDFGDIGELLKIRIEIDGSGESPDYFVDKVELRDLDTEERMVSYIGKWLRWKGNEKYVQPYREFPVFRAAFEPLNLLNYEGKMRLASSNRRHIVKEDAELQIFGEIGETGRFPVRLQLKSDGKNEIAFKTEAVSIGRIHCLRLYVTSNETGYLDGVVRGEQLYQGLSVLQAIYDKRGVVGMNVAANWLVDRVLIRESLHVPYRFVLKYSRVKDIEEDGEIFKEILLSEMEGLPTRVTKKKARKRDPARYILSMTIGERSTFAPCMHMLKEKEVDVGMITKVRVAVCASQPLNRIVSEKVSASDENVLEIQKVFFECIRFKKKQLQMRLVDTINGDELRFANMNTVMTFSSVCEFAAVWPDIPPMACE